MQGAGGGHCDFLYDDLSSIIIAMALGLAAEPNLNDWGSQGGKLEAVCELRILSRIWGGGTWEQGWETRSHLAFISNVWRFGKACPNNSY